MARTVADTALLLSVIAGDDESAPLALPGDGSEFPLDPAETVAAGTRVGWCTELAGAPVARVVREVLEVSGRAALHDVGADVHEVTPHFTGADEAFRVWRGWYYAKTHGSLVDRHRDQLNPDLVANVDYGRGLTADDLARAEDARARLWARIIRLFEGIDVLALPVSQVAPFPVEQRWVTEIEGQRLDSYLDWMRSAYWISATGLPALSVPCGFTPDGLPVGLQLVGRPRGERDLLVFARAVEVAGGASSVRPTIPSAAGGGAS
jgi:amidase